MIESTALVAVAALVVFAVLVLATTPRRRQGWRPLAVAPESLVPPRTGSALKSPNATKNEIPVEPRQNAKSPPGGHPPDRSSKRPTR